MSLPDPVDSSPPVDSAEPSPPDPPGADGANGGAAADGRWSRRRLLAGALTVAAGLAVWLALTLPTEVNQLSSAWWIRIPIEALVIVGLLLVVPGRARGWVAAAGGVWFGLLAVWKVFDIGFHSFVARPFDPVHDWPLAWAGVGFITDASGRATAIAVVAGAVVLAVLVLALVTLSMLRLARPIARHRRPVAGAAAVMGVGWLVATLLGTQLVPDVPFAIHHGDRVQQLSESLQDHREFAAEAAVDPFRDAAGDELLTALRGKDVLIAYVESYGRDAIENPRYEPTIGATLDSGDRRLAEAGFEAQSGFLTAPIIGGGSWLAHATLRSGLWVNNTQRYRTLIDGDRMTLNHAFQRAGWRTVAVMPGIFEDWPEGESFGFDEVYDREALDYQGPRMNWGIIPDQYTASAFERFERSAPDRRPVMAEMPLLTSHNPWTPVAPLIGWDEVGDGSIFHERPAVGPPAEEVLRDQEQLRTAFGHAVAYSLDTLISYVETYGDDDLVMVMLGDHQPSPLVTGDGAGADVPVTIVTGDSVLLDRIADWGWHDGLRPEPHAPVWRMDAFRDEFLTAFSAESARS